ncbi:methyltransferase domain-containing protein [Sphingomonas sp. CGMCC 1.13654]|uniref:Methyltransferase domain-containing protein n=1 Tax=Sphingomonas chungangi TaxID=2683589 RepID=A0A838L690_9SPHN|nr:methyltransferase domain-containing protein [Sphingomonas chungangi]MBA2934861.1 methyltransferase domain-containing protein [Sphingomonas chungangi]MVW58172.1 methyltransferase domain-containing protein [Sphingomonas chungangi]
MRRALALVLVTLPLAACGKGGDTPVAPAFKRNKDGFPLAARPVASIVETAYSTEAARDKLDEARAVMDKAGIQPGMTVADIGAGEGYYTVRLAARVGDKGRVLAEDIVPEVRDQLAERVNRERLDNVSVRLGDPANPRLPPNSFDRVLMVHMYHEVEQPYEFLWNVRPALKDDGELVVVDADRPTFRHGTPPRLLQCELAAVGFERVKQREMPSAGGYMAVFVAKGERPLPQAIHPCDADGKGL